jgi:hypothetical protein
MAANSSAKAGFNQSGGAYFIVLKDLEITPGTAGYPFKIFKGSRNSGGATTEPEMAPITAIDILNAGATYTALSDVDAAGFLASGKLIRDMGKTIISRGVTYRKFEIVAAATGTLLTNSFGVVGNPTTAPNTGYGSFYLIMSTSMGGIPAPIARYF